MKRSRLDILLHKREVLLRKIRAYERVRRAINELVEGMKDDEYALEALNAIDRTVFNQMQLMYAGLKRLEDEIREVQGGAGRE